MAEHPELEDAVEVEAEPEEDEELDPETAARRSAALAQIRSFGDPVLRTKARPIDRFDDALRSEIVRMGGLMDDAIGVERSANVVSDSGFVSAGTRVVVKEVGGNRVVVRPA